MTMLDIPETFDMAEVLANSYRDFHAKGLDYICLKRSFKETLKLYFFDGDSSCSTRQRLLLTRRPQRLL